MPFSGSGLSIARAIARCPADRFRRSTFSARISAAISASPPAGEVSLLKGCRLAPFMTEFVMPEKGGRGHKKERVEISSTLFSAKLLQQARTGPRPFQAARRRRARRRQAAQIPLWGLVRGASSSLETLPVTGAISARAFVTNGCDTLQRRAISRSDHSRHSASDRRLSSLGEFPETNDARIPATK